MENPKISIITPVLNGGRHIEGCIQNVLAQQCPQAEHIIVDGGSGDHTVEIIRAYQSKHPRIRLFVLPGSNQSEAMNHGVQVAQGDVLGFLNCDDYYEPQVLNRILTLFQNLPEPTFLVGNCHIRNALEQIIETNRPRKLKLTQLLTGNLCHPHPVNPSAYFYHKSLHDMVGFYRTDEDYAMDLDFILKAVTKARVKYVDETWGNFRFIPGTKTFGDRNSTERERMVFQPFVDSLSPFGRIHIRWQRYLWRISKKFHRLSKNYLGIIHEYRYRRQPS